MKLIGVAATAAAIIAAQNAGAESTLKQVIVVSRHGVRGPYGLGTETPSQKIFDQYVRNPDVQLPLRATDWGTSETDDPNEVVSPRLTKHGFNLVVKMGDYFRKHLYQKFIEDTPCEKLFAYADANQRDNLTAEAFLGGAFSTCKNTLPITAGTRLLFEQGQDPTASCPVCSQTKYTGIAGADDCRYLVQENHKEIQQVNRILGCCAPPVCGLDPSATDAAAPSTNDTSGSEQPPPPQCSLFDIPSVWSGAFYQPWKDTLSSAEYFTEFLLLQALNNMTLPRPFPFAKVKELSKLHEAHMDLVTNDVNSANFGATLLAHITASFEQRATGKNISIPVTEDGPQLEQGTDNRFLFYAGHDINILYLRNLLRLQWFTRGWHPHQPTPGGMLVFELHEWAKSPVKAASSLASATVSRRGRHLAGAPADTDAAVGNETADEPTVDRHFVKAFFVTASPEQMRHGETLTQTNPPDVVPVLIPYCSEDKTHELMCSLEKFKKLIGKTLKHECVADSLRPFVASLDAGGGGGSTPTDSSRALHVILWLLFVALVALLIAVLARHVLLMRRGASPTVDKHEYGTLPQVY